MYRLISLRFLSARLGELRKIMFAYLNTVAESISGSTQIARFFRLSLHSLQNFELVSSETLARFHKRSGSPAPSLITFAISTSQYGFIMLGHSDKKRSMGIGYR